MFVNRSGQNERSSCHVSVNLAKRFQRRRFLKIGHSETRIACGGSCLVMDRDAMTNLYRGPSIDASYQVLLYLATWFQRRFLKIDQSETRIACEGHVC
jgi:hypothetical protein